MRLIIILILGLSLGLTEIQAQEITAEPEESSFFDTDSFWDQTPIVVEKKLDLSRLRGTGLWVFILYILGVSFTVLVVHRSKASNYFAQEIIILFYLFWLVILPFSLYLLVSDKKFSRV